MRKKATLLLKKAAGGSKNAKYKELRASWKGLSWIEKTKLRKYVESTNS